MTTDCGTLILALTYLIGLVMICVAIGRTQSDYGNVAIALLWPFAIAFVVCTSPVWLAVMIGRRLRDRALARDEKLRDEGEARRVRWERDVVDYKTVAAQFAHERDVAIELARTLQAQLDAAPKRRSRVAK